MEAKTYLDLLAKQREMMTPECAYAILEQQRLHGVVIEKQRIKDELYEEWFNLFTVGCEKFSEQYPEANDRFPKTEIKAEAIREIAEQIKSLEYQEVTAKMKTISELNESSKLNEPLGKAYFDFFCALGDLNNRINSDREKLFSPEYREKMRKLADEGVFMYFLETPDFPLLTDECDANYVLESFSFGDYMSAKELFSSFTRIENPGKPLVRKINDAHDALEMMYNGCFRGAARNWFALIEHEHKRCAETLEGFWEKKKTYKNGKQRSGKIAKLIDEIDNPWAREAWEKIDTYYQKILARTDGNNDVINRNSIIHGDYNDDSMDITENDTIKLFLLWINLRLIADDFSYKEEQIENITTMIPYFCTLYPSEN